ncbi:hypothetical protein YC2023_030427 [Brassica napus]
MDEDEKFCTNRTRVHQDNLMPVKAKKGGGGGITKVCQLSPQLDKFIGTSQIARTEKVVHSKFIGFSILDLSLDPNSKLPLQLFKANQK